MDGLNFIENPESAPDSQSEALSLLTRSTSIMTFINDCLAAERDEQDEQIKAALYDTLYLDGGNDAAFGELPQLTDEVYLAGYIAKLKELPKTPDGRIRHYSPHHHFAFGRLDNPDPCGCDDEF
jgi:hypothetical protein